MIHNPYGAHEIIELHEALSQTIDAINTGQLYLPHARDPELRQILHNQLAFMTDEYNRLVFLVNGKGRATAVPYRPKGAGTSVQPLQGAVFDQPNAGPEQMDDRDVASGMLAVHKSGAIMRMHAALECADPGIRQSLLQGAANCAHQAYELWGYMSRRGYYPMAVLEQMASDQLLRGYQPAFPSGPASPQAFAEGAGTPDFAVAAPGGNVMSAVPPVTETPAETLLTGTATDALRPLASPSPSGGGESAAPSAPNGADTASNARHISPDRETRH